MTNKPAKKSLLPYIITTASLLAIAVFIYVLFSAVGGQLAYAWNWLALIPIMALGVNISLMVVVNRNQDKINNSLWFMFFLSSMLFWSFSELSLYLGANPAALILGRPLITISGLLGIPSLLIFIIGYTHADVIKRFTSAHVALLAACTTALYIALSTNVFYDHRLNTIVNSGYGKDIDFGSAPTSYLIWLQLMLIMLAVVLFRYWRRQTNKIERKKSFLVFVAVLTPIITTSLTNIFFPLIKLTYIPPMGLIASSIMAILITYGFYKYQLFIVNPATLATNILSTMTEAVVVTSNNYTILYINPAATKLLGLTSNQHLNESVQGLFQPAQFNTLKDKITDNKAWTSSLAVENFKLTKAGTTQVVSVDISISRVIDDANTLSGYVMVFNDISALQEAYTKLEAEKANVDRKVIERTQQLDQERARLQASVESMPVGFVLTDGLGQVMQYNTYALQVFNIDPKQLPSQRLAMVTSELVNLELIHKLEEVKRSGKSVNLTDVQYNKRYWHIILAPVISGNKQAIGNIILFEDITEERLAGIERSQFITTASHEMRTPLTVIEASLSNALNPKLGNPTPQQKEFLEKAHKAATHLGDLFKDITEVSDFSDQLVLKAQSQLLVSDILKQLTAQSQAQVTGKGLAWKVNAGEADLKTKITVNQQDLLEILRRLIDNAVKFTDAGGITVGVTQDTGQIHFSVADTGRGIAAANIPQLFKMFSRVNNDLTRQVGGTGLGLYIAQNLAKSNGGEITVQSTEGRGSTFTLSLRK